MPSGVQLSGKKSSIQSGDPAGDQADLLSVCACVFRPDHVLRVPDQRQKTGVSWIQIIYYSFATSMYALALTYLTSAIQVFFKDMAQIVSICLQFGMWLTPIMYSEQLFLDKGLTMAPMILKLNPFYYIAAGYRDSMLTGDWFFMRPTLTVYFWAVTLITMLVGLKVFKRLRPHFSDVL